MFEQVASTAGHRKDEPLEDRLWPLIDVRMPWECWPWLGAKNADGYGQIRECGRLLRAHRVVWSLYNGPIPEGIEICHDCWPNLDDKGCCNPWHLFAATPAQHAFDRMLKGQLARGEGHYNAKLTETAIVEMRRMATSGMTKAELGRLYGISGPYAGEIVAGKYWAHVRA